jgi:hypothetical protein
VSWDAELPSRYFLCGHTATRLELLRVVALAHADDRLGSSAIDHTVNLRDE